MPILDPADAAALRVLREELGLVRGARVALTVRLQAARGAPFRDRPAPTDAREAASRDQAGGAILVYRSLRRVAPEQALQVTARVIEAAALAFLEETVGAVRPDALHAVAPEARRPWVRTRLDRFPNVTATVDQADPGAVAFTVSACRLVTLVGEAGHPELAPLFCAGDGRFFAGAGIRLDRPTTLAAGDDACRFHLHGEAP